MMLVASLQRNESPLRIASKYGHAEICYLFNLEAELDKELEAKI